MSTDDELRVPFREWLRDRDPEMEELEVSAFELPRSGFSAKTVFVPVAYRKAGRAVEEKLVLRLENPEPALYPQQAPGLDVEIEIQYRAMEALHATGKLPIAPLFGYEADASILGNPFFVMGYIPGDVMVEQPPYTQVGFFADATPSDREEMITRGVQAMADFHSIDWQQAGFQWLVAPGEEPDVMRQVELWESMLRRGLGDRVHPDLDRAFRFLHDQAPRELEPGLVWGDARPGNIIFRDNRVRCITDFENISVAPTEIDLGYWLAFDRTQHEAIDTKRLPGEPSREQQRAIYAEHAGRTMSETYYFEVLGAVRYAAIVVPVMNRLVDRGQLPADHVIWLQNPASTALNQLLAKSAGG
ncbi:MAG: phosphotransferase family protein [Myxococcota bacterium]